MKARVEWNRELMRWEATLVDEPGNPIISAETYGALSAFLREQCGKKIIWNEGSSDDRDTTTLPADD